MIERRSRPLLAQERRLLRSKLSALPRQLSTFIKRSAISVAGICGALWLLTMLVVKDVSGTWISAFWLGAGFVIGSWTMMDEKTKKARKQRDLEEVLRHDLAQETVVCASELVEFEEIEDEGACYAFQVGESRILFVSGQDFYPSTKFPSTEFSIVEMQTTDGRLVEMLFEKRGERLSPKRTISCAVKVHLQIPGHLQLMDGRLDQIEQLLACERGSN